jgi:hypothetical protein
MKNQAGKNKQLKNQPQKAQPNLKSRRATSGCNLNQTTYMLSHATRFKKSAQPQTKTAKRHAV